MGIIYVYAMIDAIVDAHLHSFDDLMESPLIKKIVKEIIMQNREQWGSKLGFILAASGSAVGIGNIWKFPYIAGENGGAAFTLVYLLCILVVGSDHRDC